MKNNNSQSKYNKNKLIEPLAGKLYFIIPSMAKKFGFKEFLLINNVYCKLKFRNIDICGRNYAYLPMANILKDLPFLSRQTIKRLFIKLEHIIIKYDPRNDNDKRKNLYSLGINIINQSPKSKNNADSEYFALLFESLIVDEDFEDFIITDTFFPRFLPSLAHEIGLHECIVFHLLEFRIATSHHERDGNIWTYQSTTDLHNDLTFLSASSIKRAINNLKKRGLINIGNYNRRHADRTQWFSLNFKGISGLKSIKPSDNFVKIQSKPSDAPD